MAKKNPTTTVKGTTSYEHSSVAKLRAITGLSEEEFAEKIGMTASGYKSMASTQEQKGTGVSHDAALRISAATGASASFLAENQLKSIFTNNEYTRADYDYYCSLIKLMHQRWKKELVESATVFLKSMLDSILERDPQVFLPRVLILSSVLYKLENQVGSVYSDCGLHSRPFVHAGIENIAREVRSEFESRGRGYKLGTDSVSDLIRLLEHFRNAEMAWCIPSLNPPESKADLDS